MDPDKVEAVITRRTPGFSVHLFSQVAAVEELTRFGIDVVKDAAQAQGAERHGKRAGSLGVGGSHVVLSDQEFESVRGWRGRDYRSRRFSGRK